MVLRLLPECGVHFLTAGPGSFLPAVSTAITSFCCEELRNHNFKISNQNGKMIILILTASIHLVPMFHASGSGQDHYSFLTQKFVDCELWILVVVFQVKTISKCYLCFSTFFFFFFWHVLSLMC